MHPDPKKAGVQRRDHANLCPTRAKELQNSRKNSARRAHKNCVNSVSVVAQTFKCLLQLFCESVCVPMQDKARVQRRDHAKFAQKSGEKFAKISEIQHAPRTKIARSQPRCAHCTTSLRVDRVSIASRSEKSRRPALASRKFVPNSRERIAKFPKIFGAARIGKFPKKIRRAARRKVAWTQPAWLHKPQMFAAALFRVGMRSNAR